MKNVVVVVVSCHVVSCAQKTGCASDDAVSTYCGGPMPFPWFHLSAKLWSGSDAQTLARVFMTCLFRDAAGVH